MSATPNNRGFLRSAFSSSALLGAGVGAASLAFGSGATAALGIGVAVGGAVALKESFSYAATRVRESETIQRYTTDTNWWDTLMRAKTADGSREFNSKNAVGNVFLTAAFAPVALPWLALKEFGKRRSAAAEENENSGGPTVARDGEEAAAPDEAAGPTVAAAAPLPPGGP